MDEKYIPGIYNYCDRWCERCSFTSRCRNFESIGKSSGEQLDINNKAFWDAISSNLANAMLLLQKAAAEQGIDINQPMTAAEETAYEEKRTRVKKTAKAHLLSVLSKQYQEIAMPFIETNNGIVDKATELVNHLHLGITSEEDVVYTMANLGDYFEIIQWYLFFIDAKLQRALHGKLEGENWEDENNYAKDSDGSAKIAIISIERCMAAWTGIYEAMPATEDTALNALSLLSRLKQTALTEFLDAMKFKRPGFDD